MGWYIEDTGEADPKQKYYAADGAWCSEGHAKKHMFETREDVVRCIENRRRFSDGALFESWNAARVREYRHAQPVEASGLDDSGKREETVTGGLREPTEGRGAYELLPPGPIERLAKLYEAGARKYAPRNWERGIETGRIMQSLLRHVFKYLAGQRGEDHLAAVCWNAMALMHHEDALRAGTLPKELDTLPCLMEKS